MDFSSLAELPSGQAVGFTDPDTGYLWSIQKSDDLFCIESPLFDFGNSNVVAFLTGFLLENVSGQLHISSRFVASANGVHLERASSVEQIETDIALTATDFEHISSTLVGAQEIDIASSEFETEIDDPSLSPQESELFEQLNAVVLTEPKLMAVYEFQPELGLAVLESDDGDWVACVRPSTHVDHLAVLFPLGVVPENAVDAESFLTRVLRLNSALTLSSELVMGCLSDGQTLVLKAELNPRLADATDVMALLGKMTDLAEELQMMLDDASILSGSTSVAYAREDAMAMMMSGIKV